MSSTEVVLQGAWVVLGDPRDKKIEPVDLRIVDGGISEIGVELVVGHAEVIDYSDCWIIPGFVDAPPCVAGGPAGSVLRCALRGVRRRRPRSGRPLGRAGRCLRRHVRWRCRHVGCRDHVHVRSLRSGPTVERGRAAIHGLHDAGIRGVWEYGFDSSASAAALEQRLDDARALGSSISDDPLLSFGVIPSGDGDFEQFAAQVALGAEFDAPILTHTDEREHDGQLSDSEIWPSEGLLSDRHLHAFCSTTPARVFDEFAKLGCSVVSTPNL